jgi:hypothetical protein
MTLLSVVLHRGVQKLRSPAYNGQGNEDWGEYGVKWTLLSGWVEQNSSWEAGGRSASQEIRAFYGTWASIPCPLEPATGIFPEPDKSSPHHHALFY